jgi:hypothetical protein
MVATAGNAAGGAVESAALSAAARGQFSGVADSHSLLPEFGAGLEPAGSECGACGTSETRYRVTTTRRDCWVVLFVLLVRLRLGPSSRVDA